MAAIGGANPPDDWIDESMATLIKLKHESGPKKGKLNGRRAIQFVGIDGKRKTLRLGLCSEGDGRSILVHIKRLVSTRRHGMPLPEETTLWVSRLQPAFRERIESVGLLDPLPPVDDAGPRLVPTLAEFIDRYIADRRDTKASTRIVYGHTRRCLVEYFREIDAKDPERAGKGDRRMDQVTTKDAKLWRIWLKTTQDLSANTVNRRCGIAKQLWNDYLDDETMPVVPNPFRKISCTVKRNSAREFKVTREMFFQVEAQERDPVRRLIYRLARFGGLRVYSEPYALTWSDIDFERRRITVHSPKTAHHEGKETRVIPMFDELHGPLVDAFNAAPEGSVYVIAKYRNPNINFRRALGRAAKRAGYKLWPSPFCNMRRTRENELLKEDRHPPHVVRAWIGHSERTAENHYLCVDDSDFKRALEPKPTQIPTQQVSASERIGAQGQSGDTPNPQYPQENAHGSASGAEKWAMRDSNPRPPRCKRGALTN